MLGKDGQEEACFLEPYPMPGTLQQKRSIARAIGTTYIYDFLGLIEKAMIMQWRAFLADVEGQGELPGDMFRAEELVLDADGSLNRAEASRIAGSNDIGMVAWECFMKTPEYPDGRQVVLVGNDCTFMSGSFGVKEDDFYYAVSKYAREKGLPRVYIASNSGARIGLVEELKPYFKVAWNDASNPSLGFKYLYLTPEDYANFPEGTVNAQEVTEDGETRMQLDDIIGQIHGIGVENLRGFGDDRRRAVRGVRGRVHAVVHLRALRGHRRVPLPPRAEEHPDDERAAHPHRLPRAQQAARAATCTRRRISSAGPQVMMPNGVSHSAGGG
jgi:acetyl-CoA carboxylase/biotin carboxylase 1